MTYPDPCRLDLDPALPRSVMLTGRDVEDARRLLALLSEHEEESPGSALPAALFDSIHVRQDQLRQKARQILALRRRRTSIFSSAMFNEPAWEMLLSLYAADGAGRLTASRLALLSGSSKATALRWIYYLELQALISRDSHPTDKRTAFVSLTEKGRAALDDYLSSAIELSS